MKRVIFRALLCALLLILSGCGKQNSDPTIPSGNDPGQQPTETAPTAPGKAGWVMADGKTYYFLPDGSVITGKVTIGEHTYCFDSTGLMLTGWQELGGKQYYFDDQGHMHKGWLELGGKRHYFTDTGDAASGWLKVEGTTYYFLAKGEMARGKVEIDGRNRFFTSAGKEVLVVNPWNAIPEDYDPDLVSVSSDIRQSGTKVSSVCYDALVEMINDCNAESPQVHILSSYRTYDYQAGLFENRIQRFENQGYSRAEAEKLAAAVVARPGTSEHHSGLAVDIIDTREWSLEETQADLPGQQWLMKNSWKYGFILRYPKGTTDSTGIIYEPWHYRYVGKELAKELYEAGQTLEEYLDALTQ